MPRVITNNIDVQYTHRFSLRKLLGNICSGGMVTLIQSIAVIVVMPIYIDRLGIQGIGILGVFILVTNLVRMFDLGLCTTISKQVAQAREHEQAHFCIPNILRTYELIFIAIGVVTVSMIFLIAFYLPLDWFSTDVYHGLLPRDILLLAGGAAIFRWLASLYQTILIGQEHIVQNSILRFVDILLYHGVGVAILLASTNGPMYFFCWIAVNSLIHLVISIFYVASKLPGSYIRAQFQIPILKESYKFAAAIAGILIISTIFLQADRFLVMLFTDLKTLGHYTLALTISTSVISLCAFPVLSATFPRFAMLVKAKDKIEITRQYYLSILLTLLLIMPALAFIFTQADRIIFLWTDDIEATRYLAPILIFVTAGPILNAVAVPAFSILMAAEETKFVMTVSVIILLTASVLYIISLWHFDLRMLGISVITCYSINIIPLLLRVHRRYMIFPIRRFILELFLPITLLSFLVAYVMQQFLIVSSETRIAAILILACKAFLLVIVVSALYFSLAGLIRSKRSLEPFTWKDLVSYDSSS